MVRWAGFEDTQTDRGMIVITRIMVWLVSGRSSAASVMMRMGKVNWEAASSCIWVLILINSHELRVAKKIWSLSIFNLSVTVGVGWWDASGIWWYNLRIVCRGSSCLLTPSDYPQRTGTWTSTGWSFSIRCLRTCHRWRKPSQHTRRTAANFMYEPGIFQKKSYLRTKLGLHK